MKQNIRTFVAVETSQAVRRRAEELGRALAAAPADVKWVKWDNLHLTLKFLGDVDAREVHHVCEAVRRVAEEAAPFALEMRGAGAFPNAGRPRTIWLGAGAGHEPLEALQEKLESALEALGFRREARRFQVHLTIGRVRRGPRGIAELGKLIAEQADFPAGRMRVAELVTFSSVLGPSGPTYEALSRAKLSGE